MGSDCPSKSKKFLAMERQGESAWTALRDNDFDKAVQRYKKAITAAREIEEPAHEAVFFCHLGLAQCGMQRYDDGRLSIQQAIEISSRFGLLAVQAHAHLALGELEQDLGHSDSAGQAFLRAIDCAYPCEDVATIELCFGYLGRIYIDRGWMELATDWFRRALELRQDSELHPALLGSLGQAMSELGQYDSAISYYRQAFESAAKLNDVHTQSVCKGCEGNALFELGDREGAMSCYESALATARELDDPRRIATWLGNIGNTWLKLGDVQKAIECCTEAVATAKTAHDLQAESSHLDSLGDCYMAKGELNIAMEKYQEALELSKSINDKQGERIYLSNLGRAMQQMGQLQPAFDIFKGAIEIFDEQRSSIKADDLKTSFAGRGQDLYRDMIKVCIAMGKRVEALEFIGRSKSRALLDLLSNSPIDITELSEGGDESLQKLMHREQDLRSQIGQLERMFWQGPMNESGHRGASVSGESSHKLYTEWRETVNELHKLHPNYATLVSASTLSFRELTALWSQPDNAGDDVLDDETAIIEFYWTDQYVMAASIWQGATEPATHTVIDPEQLAVLDADVQAFLEMSATEGWEVPVSLCKRLYKTLMEPVAETIPKNIKRLILIPHGVLHHVPFAALHDGNGFLCEKYAISYLPTSSLIPVLAKSGRVQREEITGYLISAISDYSATRANGLVFSSRLRSAAGLDDLTFTMEEAETIYRNASSRGASTTKLVTNSDVKEQLPELFSKYPVVHFAGHAVFNQEEPLASGLVLADGSILTAAAILQGNALRTNCGKLLVLSACQTGVNSVTAGGEILGLARALMYAGMPNLVLSLWEVADRSTAKLMQDFHDKLMEMADNTGEIRVSEALRMAQANAAANNQPIHAWAPFIHMGID